MLPIGTAVSQSRERIETARISRKRIEWQRQGHRRSWLPIGYPGRWEFGGPDRDRTGDLLNAIQARSQLRYRPTQV
jgi:hypothetical protein